MCTAEFTGRLRVLIVEHVMADADLCVYALKRAGFDVDAHVVSTAEAFGEHIDEHPYDIVLADYRLPGWTGMDALRKLQQRKVDIPLILVSGTVGEERAVDCVK
jgi:DNA-binding NtrC family response regulator